MKKRFLVIGMGRFGRSVVKEIHNSKHDVVACDTSESILQEIDEYVDYTVLGDAREDSVLEDIEPEEYDSVIVAIGDGFEASILITKKLKDRGCRKVVTKANDRQRGEILQAVGADKVIYPEEEAGSRAAKQLISTNIIEHIALNEDVSAVEMSVPTDFYGKSLSEIGFTSKYGLTVALILRENKPILSHFAYEDFQEGDCFLIVGENKKIDKFKAKFCE